MSEVAQLIGEAARGILARPVEPGSSWQPLIDGGWVGIGVGESDGGQGGTLLEAAAVAEAAGATAVAAPVVESILGAIALAGAAGTRGLLADLTTGVARAAPVPRVVRGGELLARGGELVVPWGREATHAVAVAALGDRRLAVAAVPTEGLIVTRGESLAGDPLDRVRLSDAELAARACALEVQPGELIDAAALLGAARMCGALRAVARLSVDYAKQRSQFGRPIGSFQVLAHALVQQEAHVAQAEAALASALASALSGALADAEPAGRGRDGRAEAAYLNAALAVDPVVKIAHQVHGAIGVTREHELHRYTLRLTAWRSALGAVSWWSRRLGRRTLANEHWRDAIAPAAVA